MAEDLPVPCGGDPWEDERWRGVKARPCYPELLLPVDRPWRATVSHAQDAADGAQGDSK